MYLLRDEKRNGQQRAAKEKRRKKKKRTKREGGSVSQSVGREEGASKRDAREKTRLKLWREKDGTASCRRRRVRGEAGKGNYTGGAGERLGEFPCATQSQPWEFTQTVTHLPRHTLYSTKSTFAPPVATQVRFSFHFLFPLTVPPLYRYRGTPSHWQTARGVVPSFFHDAAPFRS